MTMDILNYKNHPQWISIITSAILAVITTLIIVVFLPKKTEVNYSYDLGRPWTHGKLIAEFNFEIFKSPRAIEKERDSLLKSYQPYYQMDTLVVKKALADFERDVSNDTTTVMAKYSSILERRLHFLYEKGIMEDADYDKLILDSISAIHIVKDKFESQEEMAGIIPVRVAYNRLFDDEELKDHIDQLNNSHLLFYVRANLKDDTERNSIAKDELLKSVGTSIGKITKDQLIIDQGQLVDEEKAAQIESLKEELNKKNEAKGGKTRGVGQTIFVGIFILLFTCYLHIYRRRFFVKPPNIIMLYVLIAIFPICMSEMVQHSTVSIYILPFAMVPVITQVFFDSRTAFITLATSVFISAIAANYQYDFIIIEMAGGMAAIYALSDMSKRSELMIATVVATLCSALVYYGITLFTSKSYIPQQWGMYVYILISGVLLFLAYPLMYIIEKMFNFTSNITLFELSDTNQKLLRMLSEKAPGTFVHSTTVGNLAAEVARRIKANALLVRTGALYHDIGKMDNAVFFTENQVGVNPHDKLSEKDREKESARIIVSHVTNGLKLAENENLPDVITDFIRTHHGTGMAKYFYIQYKNKHPEEEVDPKPFSYPGPNPETREQAILMMAATKSLDFYSDEIISKKVNELIDALVKSGRFEECPITFRDIAIAKQVLADKLKSIYHTRITYPKLNEEENAEKIEDR